MNDQRRLFRRPSTWPEARAVADALRTETVGGALLLLAAGLALVWSNSPWREAYATLRDTVVGWPALHLDLTLGAWASDGLLALFFFVAGLELKRELLVGDLRDPARAAVPVVAALAGVAAPALVYLATVAVLGDGAAADGTALRGWAIPTATDIAFALAVLAVLGSHLPSGMRAFLLALAVVDDLVAIVIIATVFTSELRLGLLLLAVVPLAAFGLLAQRRIVSAWLLVPLAAATWTLVHASGVHATVAGVLLGLTVPVRPSGGRGREGRGSDGSPGRPPGRADVAERLEHRLRPLSAGVAVPVFAFFAAGVSVTGTGGGLGPALTDPVTLAVVAALVVGKPVGVLGSTLVLSRLTRAELDESLRWADVVGLALLCGIGFTVSLLVGELAFGPGTVGDDHAKLGVLAGSLVSALLAAAVLVPRNLAYRRLAEHDGQGPEEGPAEPGRERDGDDPDRV